MDYIQAGGKNRPFRISYKALKELRVIEQDKPEIISQNDGLDYVEQQFFIGFKYGAIKEGLEIDFTAADVVDWVDDTPEMLKSLTSLIEISLGKLTGQGDQK